MVMQDSFQQHHPRHELHLDHGGYGGQLTKSVATLRRDFAQVAGEDRIRGLLTALIGLMSPM